MFIIITSFRDCKYRRKGIYNKKKEKEKNNYLNNFWDGKDSVCIVLFGLIFQPARVGNYDPLIERGTKSVVGSITN